MMTFRPFGDRALLIDFEQTIDPAVNAAVIALARAVEAAALPGVAFCIPAYCSLTVGYDPAVLSYDAMCAHLRELADAPPAATVPAPRRLTIPVCYEDAFAPDLPEVMAHTGLSREAIIDLHTSTSFRVYMLGFLPGFPYLGRLPDALYCPRRTTPRLRAPARSVGLAGHQTGIYPVEAPGGWQLIGRTPVPVFWEQGEPPFLFTPGDEVAFRAIPEPDFIAIERQVAAGTFTPSDLYE